MMMMLVSLGVAYVFGALTILALEAAELLIFIRRFKRKIAQEEHKVTGASHPSSAHLDPSFYNKQGIVWVLEADKVAKALNVESVPREQKQKKEILEVLPVQKYGKVKDRSLYILESDGSQTEVQLKGCTIAAVSATSLSSRKWAKKYPIKVESKESKIYKGSEMFYIYLDTSWEKEAWCKAFRLASCDDKEKLKWFAKLNIEFHRYLTSLNAEYPSFMKPSTGFNVDPVDKSIKFDGSSSKVCQLLKKFAKKASKSGLENKASWSSALLHEEKHITEKSHPFQDSGSANMSALAKPSEDIMVTSLVSTRSDLGSKSQTSAVSDAYADGKTFSDEGTLCWNILLSRLFFDAKANMELKSSLQARIQRMLLNVRSPSFIGELTCTAVDPGNLPPYINAMRVLPSHMNDLWAFEIEIEYSGGAILNVETRLEVKELDFQEGDKTLESSAVVEVTSDLLEGFEYFGKQLNISEEKADEIVQRGGEPKTDVTLSHKTAMPPSSQVSRWKSMLHSIAKQVSEGTGSQSVEEKSTAEANKGAPYSNISDRHHSSNKVGHAMQSENEFLDQYTCSAPVCPSTSTDHPLHELATPLLKIDEPGEIVLRNAEEKAEWSAPSHSLVSTGQQNNDMDDDGARPMRIGTRARMLGFGKKMGKKLEEQRRHIEERGRHIVERMKGP